MVSPAGFAQSSGTLSVVHRQSPPGAGPVSVALHLPQSSFCEVSEAGSPGMVTEDDAGPVGLPASSFFSFPPSSPDELQPATSNVAAARAVHRAIRAMNFPPRIVVRRCRG
jgi:hypothetical protein